MAAYLTLATAAALTKAPWWDEGWFASPAVSLVTSGSMGSPVLMPSLWLQDIDKYTYWVMPLYPVSLAAWFKVAGVGLLAMRAFSLLWGVVALLSWFFIMKALSRDRTIALAAFALIALDYDFITMASEGRMDMMAAALGYAAFAVYLTFRERHLSRALVAAHALVAASVFTHPNGVLACVGLWFLAVYFDRRQIRLSHLLPSAVPYVIGAIGWGTYIARNPAAFYAQFRGNASNRFAGLAAPFDALKSEIGRYVDFYAWGRYFTAESQFPVFILAIFGLAVLAAMLTRGIRQHVGHRALLVLLVFYVVSFTLFDGHKRYYYLIYVIPMYAATCAVVTGWYWDNRTIRVRVLVPVACVLVALNVGGVVNTLLENDYRTYRSAIDFINQHSNERSLVYGSAELAFDVGFGGNLVDHYTSDWRFDKQPDLVVISDRRVRDLHAHPGTSGYLEREFRPVYSGGYYRIYAATHGR
jgi:4-amino-4-deoxy-L-arabinose transferase-like glycosyltransferase